jgi:hypothetical protein
MGSGMRSPSEKRFVRKDCTAGRVAGPPMLRRMTAVGGFEEFEERWRVGWGDAGVAYDADTSRGVVARNSALSDPFPIL